MQIFDKTQNVVIQTSKQQEISTLSKAGKKFYKIYSDLQVK